MTKIDIGKTLARCRTLKEGWLVGEWQNAKGKCSLHMPLHNVNLRRLRKFLYVLAPPKPKNRMKKLLLTLTCVVSLSATAQQPATLHCESRTNGVFLYITGGQSNVQYQVSTPDFKNVAGTNWTYTYRMYSRDFVNPPEAAERSVTSRNDPNFRPQQFYKITGVLPD